MSRSFRLGDKATARHHEDGAWYPVVIERIDMDGNYHVCMSSRADRYSPRYVDPPRRRWVVDEDDLR